MATNSTYTRTNTFRNVLFGNRFRDGLLKKILIYGALLGFAVFYLMPFYWLVNTALKESRQIFDIPPSYLPNPVKFQNIADAWTGSTAEFQYLPITTYAKNTVIVTVLGTIGTLLSSSMVAYAFARIEFKGKKFLFGLIISTLMIPFAVLMVPQFIIWKELGWLDTLRPLIIPYWFGGAYNIFLMRQFFMGIPKEYDEAAKLDGASHWVIFWRIILPLSKPVLAAVGVFAFVYFWNDFLGPKIILSNPSNFTLTMYLANFRIAYRSTPWNLYMSSALIVIIPCILLFFFTQEAFLRGISISEGRK